MVFIIVTQRENATCAELQEPKSCVPEDASRALKTRAGIWVRNSSLGAAGASIAPGKLQPMPTERGFTGFQELDDEPPGPPMPSPPELPPPPPPIPYAYGGARHLLAALGPGPAVTHNVSANDPSTILVVEAHGSSPAGFSVNFTGLEEGHVYDIYYLLQDTGQECGVQPVRGGCCRLDERTRLLSGTAQPQYPPPPWLCSS